MKEFFLVKSAPRYNPHTSSILKKNQNHNQSGLPIAAYQTKKKSGKKNLIIIDVQIQVLTKLMNLF